MSNITDWIKYELYPSLFDVIDVAFPEHQFRRYSRGWKSKTYINGAPHKDRLDKTVITSNAPTLIMEQGGPVKSLIDYVMERDSLDFIGAVKALASKAGVLLPQDIDFDKEEYGRLKDQANILESCNSYFTYCLQNMPEAKQVREYLQGRGYSSDDISAMQLGFIPSQERLYKHLKSKDYDADLVNSTVKFKTDGRIGSTHNLTIPYRSGGSLKGFKFRTITGASPKYLNSPGLEKNSGFFNLLGLKGDKDVTIVEGELDSLHATVKGVNNVVATGGSSVSAEQIVDAIRRGAKRFTICLDTEPGKEALTTKTVNSIIEVITGNGVNRVYIGTLPVIDTQKTDPDRLVKEQGIEAFKSVIRQALPYYEYRLSNLIHKFYAIQQANEGGLTHKNIHDLLDEVVEMAASLDPIDKDRFNKAFIAMEAVQGLNVTEESLDITVDRIRATKDREAQSKDLTLLLKKAADLQSQGKTTEALDLLNSQYKSVKLKDKAAEFSDLLKPISEDELRARQSVKPESLATGYYIGGEELLLPSGAISILAAPTSHGKTTFLINLALSVSEAHKNKEIYFFSYEEDGDSILINALNTYMDHPLSGNNRTTLKNHFAGKNRAVLPDSKDKFFNELITPRRLNINYTSYDSDTLVEAVRYLHKYADPGAIFIDYVQLLNLPEGKYKTYSRQEEIKEICIALKDLAVETGLPIILGAQFNRQVTSQLHIHATRIGEAGDIERIAALIVGFWNNNFTPVATEAELKEIYNKGFDAPNTLYTTVLKSRGGRVGLNECLPFNGNTGKIKSPTQISNPF